MNIDVLKMLVLKIKIVTEILLITNEFNWVNGVYGNIILSGVCTNTLHILCMC